ncbi:cell adhesion molecule Dscam2-like [Uloborus diversus]|uniref:cell adhesion molecule Dscam2-like n=1 Tax=Uloborus diversus TaxID=327109 RepID=UPI00240A3B41|nr:cell adhesion molecule Dscam2-like [Uloborus diversus]
MAVLRCPIPSAVSDYVKVISWERIDGFMITPNLDNGKYGMLENGDLYLQDTSDHENSFSYRCHTENIITREKKVSTNYSRIIVTEPHHGQPPRIMQRSSIVNVPVGEKTTLSCVSQGYPVPVYRWHKMVGNQPVSLQMSSSARQDGGVLIFYKVLSTDGGRYVCHVSNTMGEDSVQTELVVEESLQVAISPRELQMDVGRTSTFNCNVSGSPLGSVLWKKDMRLLSANPRISFPSPYVIQVKQLKRQDAGMYQCFVFRDSFSTQASARLIIGDLAPKFKSTFSEKTVRPGSYVSLSCVATGNPEPHIRWSLDNIWPLSTRPGTLVNSYLSSESTVTSYVNFTSVDIIDSGIYSCEALNDAGKIKSSNRLNVFGPIFIRPLDNLTALAGATFNVICPFGGFPYESITWKKEGRPLPVNQRQIVYPNGTLQIMDVQPGVDNGHYSCEVISGQGMQPASRTFRVVVRAGPKLASFAFRDNLHEGMRTAVTCIVLAGDGPLNTRWLKDERPITEQELNVNILQEDDGFISTLTFKNLTYKHNGNYTCVSTNDVASGFYSNTLTVKVPPRWMLEPSDLSTVAGRPARIDCQADGVPQPHVRWKMATSQPPEQFKTIVSSSHIHILVNGSLNFRSVEATDAGHYLCEANNGVGPGLSAVVRLTVHSAPHFLTKFLVVTTRRGERAAIECSPEGDQPLSFIWRKNGIIIDLTKETRYSQLTETVADGVRSKLIIEKSERKDSSLITCTASNDYGEDSINIQITVQDIPDAPQHLEIHDVSSRSVRLSWKRPFDGNFPITRYTIMWRQTDGQNAGGPLHVPGSETTIIIRGLRPKTRYFFRVKCENALGESQYGAEVAVTTLEEPPSSPPQMVKAFAVSSKSINVTWQTIADDVSSIDGFYVGYKIQRSPETYTYKSVELKEGINQNLEIQDLNRYTEYSIVVQSYNSRGAGPPSDEVIVRTLEFDRPNPPIMRTYSATAKSVKLSWDPKNNPNAPVSGYLLFHRMDGNQWQETQLTGDRSVHTLKDLQCGTSYSFYLVAYNAAGRGNNSEAISAKTDGSPPIAPDKRLLLSVNSTAVSINLNSWHNGGCPINGFVIQYRPNGQQEWTLVSNNIIPDQQNITITDLVPGSWYSLLMTARNDAGSTDAEYIFATLTLSGEYPPRPSKVSDMSGSFYRHLTITVPVVSSIIVLLVVMCAVCFITRRHTSGTGQRRINSDSESRDPVKSDNLPLSVTYDSGHEPAYIPAPYATSRVSNYSREHCIVPGGNVENVGTFGSTRSGYTYNVPNPPRRIEKGECIYESPKIYLAGYHHTEIRTHCEHPIYEVPDRGRMKLESSRSWRESGDGDSSSGSDNEDLLYTLHSPDDRIIRDEARESETECDRLWKTFEANQYEGSKRWKTEHTVLA